MPRRKPPLGADEYRDMLATAQDALIEHDILFTARNQQQDRRFQAAMREAAALGLERLP